MTTPTLVGITFGNVSFLGTAGTTIDISSLMVAPNDVIVFGMVNGDAASAVTFTVSGNQSGSAFKVGSDLYSNDTRDTNLTVQLLLQGSRVDTSITVTTTDTTNHAYAWIAYAYRDVGTPVQDVAAVQATGSSDLANPPAITPVTPNSKVVVIYGASQNPLSNTTSWGVIGNIDDFLQQKSSNKGRIAIGDWSWTSGSYDPPPVTGGDSGGRTGNSWAATTLALRPFSPATTDGTVVTEYTSGPGSITIPTGINLITVEAWGGGGSGGNGTPSPGGGGGGYVKTEYVVSPGDVVYWNVAGFAGGASGNDIAGNPTWFNLNSNTTTNSYTATGGLANNTVGAAGGSFVFGTQGTNNVGFNGGNGSAPVSSSGGGGGGGAGSANNGGSSSSSTTGGVGGSPDGGSGGNGGTGSNSNGFNGVIPGGGGGGYHLGGSISGAGASGAIRYTLHFVPPSGSNISFQWF